jgi:hypothetical protein
MRIRTVKPDFFFDEELTLLPHSTRLLFIGMWGLADRDGRMEDRPSFIRASIFPYEAEFDTESALSGLSPKFIERYEVDGRRFIWIRKFHDHQRITGKEFESVSRFPKAPGETTGKQPGNTPNTRDVQEGKGREGKGREGNGKVVESKGNQGNDFSSSQIEEAISLAVDFSGDSGSRAFFQKAVRVLGPEMVRQAVGEVADRERRGVVDNKAHYLVKTLKDWMEGRGVKN